METEAKYAFPDAALLEQLKELNRFGRYHIKRIADLNVTDTYFDTADRRIQAEGYACRLRQTANESLLGVKSLGNHQDGIHQREEYEQEMQQMVPVSEWPVGKAQDLLRPLVGERSLEALCVLRQHRIRSEVFDAERFVGELSLDTVTAEYRDQKHTFFEAEVELEEHGTLDDLHALGHVFEGFGLQPESRSKLEHAQELLTYPEQLPGSVADVSEVTRPKRSAIIADEPVPEVGRKVLRRHYKRLLKHEDGTRMGDDIEDLHQMRVATRRLRAALQVFGPYLPAKQVRQARKCLRATTRALGPVRDMDVQIERLQAFGADEAADSYEMLLPLLDSWHRRRQKTHRKMLKYLASRDYKDFKCVLKRLTSKKIKQAEKRSPGESYHVAMLPVRHIVPALLWNLYQRIWAYEIVLDGAPVEVLHALRIDCKRFRYALESVQRVLGESRKALIAPISEAQEHLGELQDADVSRQLVATFLKEWRAQDNATPLPLVERYLAVCKSQIQCRRDTFTPIWLKLNNVEYRKLLGDTLAEL